MYLFEELSADLVFVSHYDFNTQSRRVIEKCGFAFLYESEHLAKQLGKTYPTRHYAIDRKRYFEQTK
jgi:RimJ/RimL family protein N-acetyltransferase